MVCLLNPCYHRLPAKIYMHPNLDSYYSCYFHCSQRQLVHRQVFSGERKGYGEIACGCLPDVLSGPASHGPWLRTVCEICTSRYLSLDVAAAIGAAVEARLLLPGGIGGGTKQKTCFLCNSVHTPVHAAWILHPLPSCLRH